MFLIYLTQINFLISYFLTLYIFFFSCLHSNKNKFFFNSVSRIKNNYFLYLTLIFSIFSFAGLPPFINFFFKLYFFSFLNYFNLIVYGLNLIIFFLISLYFYVRYLRLILSGSTDLIQNEIKTNSYSFISVIIFLLIGLFFAFSIFDLILFFF